MNLINQNLNFFVQVGYTLHPLHDLDSKLIAAVGHRFELCRVRFQGGLE
jgi:hypothetical protein